jgi:hypothetical protein
LHELTLSEHRVSNRSDAANRSSLSGRVSVACSSTFCVRSTRRANDVVNVPHIIVKSLWNLPAAKQECKSALLKQHP